MSNACIDGYLESLKRRGNPTFVISWGRSRIGRHGSATRHSEEARKGSPEAK